MGSNTPPLAALSKLTQMELLIHRIPYNKYCHAGCNSCNLIAVVCTVISTPKLEINLLELVVNSPDVNNCVSMCKL